jgi:hypothetical protein
MISTIIRDKKFYGVTDIESIPKKQTNDRSANSMINGTAFQYAAAIFIFISEMKNIKAVGLEDTDDIRLVLKNGQNIYAQAKSSLEPDPLYHLSHLSTDIKDSMETLYINKDNNISKLISIFNYHNPFGQQPKFNETRNTIRTYHDLTTKLKKKIKEYCNNDEEMLNKLEFWFLRFEGSKDPFDDITNIVDEYIKRIDSKNIYTKDLITKWRAMMENNGRNKKELIDFNYIIGSIFSHILQNCILFEDVIGILNAGEIDNSNLEKMSQVFNEKLRNLVSFEEYANVLGAYTKFKELNPTLLRDKNLLYKKFAEEHCQETDLVTNILFEYDNNPDLLAITYKRALLIAYSMKSEVIRKVREVFDYEN